MKKIKDQMGPVRAALHRLYSYRDPRLIMKSFANDLFSTYKLSGPPFSPFEYARSLNLKVEYDDIEAEGVFISKPDDTRIILRKENNLTEIKARRANFTLAHEIGHYVIRRALMSYMPASKFRRINEAGDEQYDTDHEEEWLCDTFASELLMPSVAIAKDFQRLGFSPESMFRLANSYDVSLMALLCRATMLSRKSLVCVIWNTNGQNFSVNWASPNNYRDLILCNTGKTTVERAFLNREPQFGIDYVMLNGKRMRWSSISQQMRTSSKILTLMGRPSKSPFRFATPATRQCPAELISAPVPTQPLLPF